MTDSDHNDVALWAGVSAFFGSLLALGLFDLLDIKGWWALFSGIIVAGVTAGGVYAKERLNTAKTRNERMEKVIKQ